MGADVAVFGHTHVAIEQIIDGVLIVNPGSISRPRDAANGSFMMLDLQPDKSPLVKLIRI